MELSPGVDGDIVAQVVIGLTRHRGCFLVGVGEAAISAALFVQGLFQSEFLGKDARLGHDAVTGSQTGIDGLLSGPIG